MHVFKKIILWVLGIAVVVIAILYTIGVNVGRIEMWRVKNQGEIYEKQVQEELNKYKNDFDGGKTPEETLELYITALKAGDIEKASKYYEISVQEEALMSLEEEMQKFGNLKQSLDYIDEVYKNGLKICNEQKPACTFEYEFIRTEASTSTVIVSRQAITLVSPVGTKGKKIIDISLNQYTDIWKIDRPY